MKRLQNIALWIVAALMAAGPHSARADRPPTGFTAVTFPSPIYGTPIGNAYLWIQDTVLCPGQVADLGVYMELQPGPGAGLATPSTPNLQNFMFYLYVDDTSAMTVETKGLTHYQGGGYDYYMGSPIITEVQEGLGGSMAINYQEGKGTASQNDPSKGTLMVVWNGPLNPTFFPDPTKPLFKVRLRCKAQKTSTLSFQASTVNAHPSMREGYQMYIRTARITPGPGPKNGRITMPSDTVTLCVGSSITLVAEGGSGYLWTQLYNPSISGGYQNEYLTNANTSRPLFSPKNEGPYLYQVEIFDSIGCSDYDTIRIGAFTNRLKDRVSIDPAWSFLDSGASELLTVKGTLFKYTADVPIHVTLSPESIFAPGESSFTLYSKSATEHLVSTMPMTEHAFVLAEFEDEYHCKEQASASLFVRGVEITGSINPFPVFRCGTDNSDKSIQLNVVTSGGSGHFLYSWSVKDLEFGAAGNPVIDNPYIRNPWLTYKGLCMVSVDVFDQVTSQHAVITDTMQYRDWIHPKVELVPDMEDSTMRAVMATSEVFCEDTRLAYRALPQHEGDSGYYFKWRINGITQAVTSEPAWSHTFFGGDSLDVILFSSENCAAEQAVVSNVVYPQVEYPVMMSASASLAGRTGDPTLAPCYDSLDMKVHFWNTGNEFRLQWYRNGDDLIYDEYITGSGWRDTGSIVTRLPRTGFYDRLHAVISECKRPCIIFNEAPTDEIYINNENTAYTPDRLMEAGPVRQTESAVCEMESFTLTASPRYLPREFMLIWYKKLPDTAVPLGYYRYVASNSNKTFAGVFASQITAAGTRALYDLADANRGYGYAKATGITGVRDMQHDGFKIILNDPNTKTQGNNRKPTGPYAFRAGDTVFYEIYNLSAGVCGHPLYSVRSENFAPHQLQSEDYSTKPFSVVLADGAEKVCAHSALSFVPKMENLSEEAARNIKYSCKVEGRPGYVSGMRFSHSYDSVRGSMDTAYIGRALPRSKVTLTFTAFMDSTVKACGMGLPREITVNIDDFLLESDPFYIEHCDNERVICEGEEVDYWVRPHFYGDGATTWSDQLEFAWSQNLNDIKNYVANGSVAAGMRLDTAFKYTPLRKDNPDNSDSTGIGDINDTKGTTVWYFFAGDRESKCGEVDSVKVLMARAYPVKAGIRMLQAEHWCDTLPYVDSTFWVSGYARDPRSQFLVPDVGCTNFDSIDWKWVYNGRPSTYFSTAVDTMTLQGNFDIDDTIGIIVRNSQYTCLDKYDTAQVVLKMIKPFMLRSSFPASAAVGDTVVMWTFPRIQNSNNVVMSRVFFTDAHYAWYHYENDDWKWIPTDGVARGERGIDSLLTVIPETGGLYRVDVWDKDSVCPAVSQVMDIEVAVPTGLRLQIVEQNTGLPLTGMCASDGKWIVDEGDGSFRTVDSGIINLNVEVENASGDAYVTYYRNGKTIAAQPVGNEYNTITARMKGTNFLVLQKGARFSYTAAPGDVFMAVYTHDTLSLDGARSHMVKQSFEHKSVNGPLKLVADNDVICPGKRVNLQALFTNPTAGNPSAGQVNWTSVPAGAYTAVEDPYKVVSTRLEKETFYRVTASDSVGCLWTDTTRILLSREGYRVPFFLHSRDSVFCGDSITADINVVFPFAASSTGSVFKQIYYYIIDRDGVLQAFDSGYIAPDVTVRDGYRAFAEAYLNVDCNELPSYSDTVYFRSLQAPRITRIAPVGDTVLCAGRGLKVEFEVEPAIGVETDEACVEWNTSLPPVSLSELGNDLSRTYRADRSTDIVFRSALNRLPGCASQEVIHVGVAGEQYEELKPSVHIHSTVAEAWTCSGDTVVYTLESKFCDSVVWYVNGEAVKDSSGVCYTGTELARVPRMAGLRGAPDSVWAEGFMKAGECVGAAHVVSNVKTIRRVEAPRIAASVGDTTVLQGQRVTVNTSVTDYYGPASAAPSWLLCFPDYENFMSPRKSLTVTVTEDLVIVLSLRQDSVPRSIEGCEGTAVVNIKMQAAQPVYDTVFVSATETQLRRGDTTVSGSTAVVHRIDSAVVDYSRTQTLSGRDTLIVFDTLVRYFDTTVQITDSTYVYCDSVWTTVDSVYRIWDKGGATSFDTVVHYLHTYAAADTDTVYVRYERMLGVDSSRTVHRTGTVLKPYIPVPRYDTLLVRVFDSTWHHYDTLETEGIEKQRVHRYDTVMVTGESTFLSGRDTLTVYDTAIRYLDSVFRTVDSLITFIDSVFRGTDSVFRIVDTSELHSLDTLIHKTYLTFVDRARDFSRTVCVTLWVKTDEVRWADTVVRKYVPPMPDPVYDTVLTGVTEEVRHGCDTLVSLGEVWETAGSSGLVAGEQWRVYSYDEGAYRYTVRDSVYYVSDTLLRKVDSTLRVFDTLVRTFDSAFRIWDTTVLHSLDTTVHVQGVEIRVDSTEVIKYSYTQPLVETREIYRSDTISEWLCDIYPAPVVTRLLPLAADTTVCPGTPVEITYGVRTLATSASLRTLNFVSRSASPDEVAPKVSYSWQLSESAPHEIAPDSLSITVEPTSDLDVTFTAYRREAPVCYSSAQVHISMVKENLEAPVLRLEADREWTCEDEQVFYTLQSENCDSLCWMINGEAAGGDYTLLQRTPRLSGLSGPADSVWVRGWRKGGICAPALEANSHVKVVRRVLKPEFTGIIPDTTVNEDAVVRLYARASSFNGTFSERADIYWYDEVDELLGQAEVVELEMGESETFRAVARLGALPQNDPVAECYTQQSVRVTVIASTPEPPKPDTVYDVFVPNTLIPASSVYADRVLRVYGAFVKEVRLQVFDAQGNLLFDKRGAPAQTVWHGNDALGYTVPAGIYTYRLKAWMTNGKVIDKQSWVSVVR